MWRVWVLLVDTSYALYQILAVDLFTKTLPSIIRILGVIVGDHILFIGLRASHLAKLYF